MAELILKEESYLLMGACMEVYNTLGPGFLESVYQEALSHEFEIRKIPFRREYPMQIMYKDIVLDKKFYADFLCFDQIIVEIKAVETLLPEHEAQLLNYLKATKMPLGLLINFGSGSLQKRRFANTIKD